MSDQDPTVEELIAKLKSLDDERHKLLDESRRVREQLLDMLGRKKPDEGPQKLS